MAPAAQGGGPARPDPFPRGSMRNLESLVRRAHEELGHPHRERLLRILKAGKASDVVMQIARQLKCSVCESAKRPMRWRRAAPRREIGFKDLAGVDTTERTRNGKMHDTLNVIDVGVRLPAR